MRYFEIASGVKIPVNLEEQNVLDTVGTGMFLRADLDERQAEVARQMVSKGLLHRHKQDGKMYFSANSAADIWRS